MSNLIKEARRAKKMTQDELAQKLEHDYDLKINRATLSKYESGKIEPPVKHLKKIAAALSFTSWTDLVSEEKQAQTVIDHIKEELSEGQTTIDNSDRSIYPEVTDDDINSEEYKLGFKAALIDAAKILRGQDPSPPPLTLEEAKTTHALTNTDKELLRLGGFDALMEFYLLPDDAQQKAMKDIRAFIEFTIAKYQKQQDE